MTCYSCGRIIHQGELYNTRHCIQCCEMMLEQEQFVNIDTGQSGQFQLFVKTVGDESMFLYGEELNEQNDCSAVKENEEK